MGIEVSELSKETLAALLLHYQQVDVLRVAANNALIEKLNAHAGDAHELFNQWSAAQSELTEKSNQEIARIIGGVAPGQKGN
jgi:hypothetical protein